MAIIDQLAEIINSLDMLSKKHTTGYGLTIEDRVYTISDQLKDLAEAGFGDLPIHICGSTEYDHETGEPTIDNPEENAFYLVPSGSGKDMYDEWVYTNDAWERFGSGGSMSLDAGNITYDKTETYNDGTVGNVLNRLINQPSWKGKILYTYGDSITEQGRWQPYLNRICNFNNIINGGHSGYRLMLLATSENIDAITNNFDIMVIMAGINDWAQDRQIGSISDVNTDADSFTGTFYGGLNQMLNYLTTKWPDRRFMFITPTYTYLNDSSKFFNGTGHGDVNSIGLTIRDYADAMVAACKKWNIPCLDLLSEIGWNKNNISTYVQNDQSTTDGTTYANYSHPNNAGAKIIASVIANKLQSIVPIS